MSAADSLALLSPVLAVAGTGLTVLVLDLFLPKGEHRPALALVSLAGCALALFLAGGLWQGQIGPHRDLAGAAEVFSGAARVDRFGLFLWGLLAGCTAGTVLVSMGYAARRGFECGEYYALVLFAAAGGMLLVASTHLVTLFVALETLSIAAYALVGITLSETRSSEGAMKYFIQGSFAAAFLLYGVALLYGATGSLTLQGIGAVLASGRGSVGLFVAGLALTLVGIAFKVGAVPFHWWVGDAYEGAASPVTAFLASAIKVAGFGFLGRVALAAFEIPEGREFGVPVLAALAVVTMVLGSFLALVQTNLKRMLAYSSIVHTGYALVGLVATGAITDPAAAATAFASVPLYLAVYAVMTLGAFAAVAALETGGREREGVAEYRGLATRRPGVALALAICLVSLAGLPPTAGFFGKFQLFAAAVDARFSWLALVGVAASVVSLYYYLRVAVALYMDEPKDDFAADFDPWGVRAALLVTSAAVVVLGILPGGLLEAALASARGLAPAP
ncbi:MAG: NADH-quinone oxidoreductase subunit N [Planctomycetes bacterium]|nr:NADH-quinone oxidoreductase subunit N [Planctomycetota bacterium]